LCCRVICFSSSLLFRLGKYYWMWKGRETHVIEWNTEIWNRTMKLGLKAENWDSQVLEKDKFEKKSKTPSLRNAKFFQKTLQRRRCNVFRENAVYWVSYFPQAQEMRSAQGGPLMRHLEIRRLSRRTTQCIASTAPVWWRGFA
jgi:hypothetical protein